MNLVKSQDFFNPLSVSERCHIIGCGSVGSTIAELLARLGLTKISLYDFDIVSEHNLANQMFFERDIKKDKVVAVKEMLLSINHEIESDLLLYPEGWTPSTKLNGYVFLCVDNIDLRREIATKHRFNPSIKAMFDVRTRLLDAQSFAADWNDKTMVDNLLKSMAFTHEEAKRETPMTACHVEMGVAPTVRIICSYCVTNFMNFVLGKPIKKIITADAFAFDVDSY